MGFLKNLMLRRSRREFQESLDRNGIRRDLIQKIGPELGWIVNENVEKLGFARQQLPKTGCTGDLRSRAYLMGLADASILENAKMNPTENELNYLTKLVFFLAYGGTVTSFRRLSMRSVIRAISF